MWWVSKSAGPDQTLRQRRSGWSRSTLFTYVPRSLSTWHWPNNGKMVTTVNISQKTWVNFTVIYDCQNCKPRQSISSETVASVQSLFHSLWWFYSSALMNLVNDNFNSFLKTTRLFNLGVHSWHYQDNLLLCILVSKPLYATGGWWDYKLSKHLSVSISLFVSRIIGIMWQWLNIVKPMKTEP